MNAICRCEASRTRFPSASTLGTSPRRVVRAQVSVANGNLILTAVPLQTPIDGFNYTSGWVDSGNKVAFGPPVAFEASSMLPFGPGTWPAVWLCVREWGEVEWVGERVG
jgi:hypothetical protein